MTDRPYCCYVLWSRAAGRYYIGVTEDVDKRLAEHNAGVSKWTHRHAGTWTLAWQKEFPSLGDARRFENRLKAQKGGNGFHELTGLPRIRPAGS